MHGLLKWIKSVKPHMIQAEQHLPEPGQDAELQVSWFYDSGPAGLQ